MNTTQETAGETKQYNVEDFNRISSLRHKMHVSRSATDYSNMLEEAQLELNTLSTEYGLTSVRLAEVDPCDICCDNDECMGDCSECDELYEEAVLATKHDNNTLIEDWMTEVEIKLELPENTIRPTGMARYNYAMSM